MPEDEEEWPEGDEEVCGFSYDHKLELTGSEDGVSVWVCGECGAEIIETED